MSYTITVKTGDDISVIHKLGTEQSVYEAKMTEYINMIPSLSFVLYPDNCCFDSIEWIRTEVIVMDDGGEECFSGHVISINTDMTLDGTIYKEVLCEGEIGYLCNTVIPPLTVELKDGAVTNRVLADIIALHNANSDQKFAIGECAVETFPESVETEWGNTYDIIKSLFVDTLGGEIRMRKVDGVRYIDFSKGFGKKCSTAMELAVNLQAMTIEKEPQIVTRLYPVGGYIADTNSRLTVEQSGETSGKSYIEDAELVAKYGVYSKVEYFDIPCNKLSDLGTASKRLYRKAKTYFDTLKIDSKNYKIRALDLSCIDVRYEKYEMYNTYPLINKLTGTEENVRITGKTYELDRPFEAEYTIGTKRLTMSKILAEEGKK